MPSIIWMGLCQSVEGLDRTNRLTLSQVRENSCLDAWARTSVLPAFRAELKHWLFLDLELAFGLKLILSVLLVPRPSESDKNYTISSPESLDCSCKSWNFTTSIIVWAHLYVYTYTYTHTHNYTQSIGSVSLGNSKILDFKAIF